METPEFKTVEGMTEEGYLLIVREISAWFAEVQERTPPLRRLRITAVGRLLKAGYDKRTIADKCGISEHRVKEISKYVVGHDG